MNAVLIVYFVCFKGSSNLYRFSPTCWPAGTFCNKGFHSLKWFCKKKNRFIQRDLMFYPINVWYHSYYVKLYILEYCLPLKILFLISIEFWAFIQHPCCSKVLSCFCYFQVRGAGRLAASMLNHQENMSANQRSWKLILSGRLVLLKKNNWHTPHTRQWLAVNIVGLWPFWHLVLINGYIVSGMHNVL